MRGSGRASERAGGRLPGQEASCSLEDAMTMTCHRCGGDLPGDVRGFCPTCGAPQLLLNPEAPAEAEAGETTSAPPPPRPQELLWPVALRYAALIAVIAAALFALAFAVPVLGLPSLLLLSGASFLTVGLYRRREPAAPMTPGIGARIGLSTGLLLTAALALTVTAALLVARFRTHAMGGFDAQWAAQTQDLVERTKASTQMPAESLAAIAKPEFRAASMLMALAILSVMLIAVSTGTGAFAGSIAVRARPKG